MKKNTLKLKKGLAQMFKGGVIMDVVHAEQAKIAEEAGAVAVMALERVPSDIRKDGGVARMSDPKLIQEIMEIVSIPVMAKVRIGHFAEAQILESLGVDYIDESEVLTPADEKYHIDKSKFKTPFVCGARNLGEALRRIQEGASMIRTKGEAGTGNIVEAVKHMTSINEDIEILQNFSEKMLEEWANNERVNLELAKEVKKSKRFPFVNFAAGGVATPADASLMMQMGCDGIFVGSGIFKSSDPSTRAKAIVKATLHFNNPKILQECSTGLGEAMESLETSELKQNFAERGW